MKTPVSTCLNLINLGVVASIKTHCSNCLSLPLISSYPENFNMHSFFSSLFQHCVEERRVSCVPVGSASQGNSNVMATTTVMIGVMRSIAVSFLNLAVFRCSTESIQGNVKTKVGYWYRIGALHSICVYWYLDSLSCHWMCLSLLTLATACVFWSIKFYAWEHILRLPQGGMWKLEVFWGFFFFLMDQ